MSRLRAETMPAVTVPPRLNGLPIAITHSPSRSLSESPNFTALSGLSGFTRSSARSVLVSRPSDFGLERVPSLRMTVDLVGVGDDVVVGHHDAGRIDDEAGAQRIDPARRVRPALIVAAACPRRFLKKSSKNSSNGEPGGSCGIALLRHVDGLRGRDVDDRIDDLLRRHRRCCPDRAPRPARREAAKRSPPRQKRQGRRRHDRRTMQMGRKHAPMGVEFSWKKGSLQTAPVSGAPQVPRGNQMLRIGSNSGANGGSSAATRAPARPRRGRCTR